MEFSVAAGKLEMRLFAKSLLLLYLAVVALVPCGAVGEMGAYSGRALASAPSGAPSPGTIGLTAALAPSPMGVGVDELGKVLKLNCTNRVSVCMSGNEMLQNITYRFIGENLTPENSTFIEMVQGMKSTISRLEQSLQVSIEMIIRPGASATIYGPDGVNGSRIAYAPTPAQYISAGGRRLRQSQDAPKIDDLPTRFTRFASTDVEMRLIGNASSSLLDFYNYTALSVLGKALTGSTEVRPMPFNLSTTANILPITSIMRLTPIYVLGTVLQVTGADQFPVSTQTQVLLLIALEQLTSSNPNFLYHHLQAVWSDKATAVVRQGVLTYVTKPLISINQLTGTDIGTLMNELVPKIGGNFTVFVKSSVALGTRAEELAGQPQFVVDVSSPPETRDRSPLNWWQILLVTLGGIVALLLIAALIALPIKAYRRQKEWAFRGEDMPTTVNDSPSPLQQDITASHIKRWSFTHMFDQATSANSSKGLSSKLNSGESSTSFQGPADTPEWSIPPEDLAVFQDPDGSDCVLGEGSFGCVYKGSKRGELVAIKQLSAFTELDLESFVKEMTDLRQLAQIRSANLVQFHGMCFTDMDSMLIFEYVSGGNLCDIVMDDKAGHYRWAARGARALCDIAQGLEFLHSKGFVHGDLKCKNVLLAADGCAKIADTGLVKLVGKQLVSAHLATAETFAYAAPEFVLHDCCTLSTDIYAFGVVMWEVCTHELPIRGSLRAINVPYEAPEQVANIVQDCLAREPLARPTASDVLLVLQNASANVGWLSGRLQTVPEVSESGLHSDASSSRRALEARTTGSTGGTRTQGTESGINTDHSAAENSSRGSLLTSEKRQNLLSANLRRQRSASGDLEEQGSESAGTGLGLEVSRSVFIRASKEGEPIQGRTAVEELQQQMEKQLSHKEGSDKLSPLPTASAELEEMSKAAEKLLQTNKGRADLVGTSLHNSSQSDVQSPSVLLPPRAIRSVDGTVPESEPSQALSDDVHGKVKMADKTFEALHATSSPLLLESSPEVSTSSTPRMGLNQHMAPKWSWEKNSEETATPRNPAP